MSEPELSLDSYLHYGCLITLSSIQGSFVHSEGFIDDSLYLCHSDQIDDFSQAIFRVLPHCMHSVQSELTSSIYSDPKSFPEKFNESEEKFISELKGNLDTYEEKKGKFILFGSIVYLQHVQSHRFLTIKPDNISRVDKDSLKVHLADFPDDNSYIKLEPSYNFQKEGKGYIRKNDIIILEISLKSKTASVSVSEEYITSNLSTKKTREINACFDKRPKWQVNMYSTINLENSKLIMCSNYIWISQSEGKAVFIGSIKENHSHVFFHSNLSNCNGLWEIENEDLTEGSFIYSDRKYRIKHLSSGLYLTLEETEGGVVGRLSDKDHLNSFWRFEQVHSKKLNSKVYSEQFYCLTNERLMLKLQALESNDQQNLIVIGFNSSLSESSYLKIIRAEPNTLWESQFTKSCIPILSSFIPNINYWKSNELHPYTMIINIKDHVDIMNKCLKDIKKFIHNKLQNSITASNYYGVIDKNRQKSLKELGIIEILTKILVEIFKDEFSLSKVLALPKETIKDSKVKFTKIEGKVNISKDFNTILLKYLASTAQKIYKVITCACQSNLENQIYVFKFLHIFQSHAGYDLGATKCLISILRNNEHLLFKLNKSNGSLYHKHSVIDHYIYLLKKFHKERKPQLIEFLKTICSCNKLGVAENQEKVHEILFYMPDSYNKIVIPTSVDAEKKCLMVLLKDSEGHGEVYEPFLECFKDGNIEKYKHEMIYFTKLIDLFSSLCKGRNYVCKASINSWFPLNFLLDNIWNTDLTLEIRANFVNLLISMHIDFQPRNHIKKPELIRTTEKLSMAGYRSAYYERHIFYNTDLGMEIVKNMRTNIERKRKKSTFSSFRKAPVEDNSGIIIVSDDEFPMFLLKAKLIEYFEENPNADYNVFTLQLLKLAILLVNFNIITLENSNIESRVCYYYESEKFRPENSDIYRLLKAIQKFFIVEVKRVYRKPTIIKTETVVAKKSLEAAKKNKEKLNSDLSDDPFAGYLEGIQKFMQFKAKHLSTSNLVSYEIKCKKEMCKLINLCIDIKQESHINHFIERFYCIGSPLQDIIEFLPLPILAHKKNERSKNSILCSQSSHFDPLPYVINNVAEYSLTLFYSTFDFSLKSEILSLVFRFFNQRKEFVKNIKQVKIMTMENDPEIVLWCKINVATFRIFTEQSETICKYWEQTPNISKKNAEKLETLTELLKNFASVMLKDTKLMPNGLVHSSNKIDKDRQVMLRNLGFHEYTIGLIKDSMHILEEIHDNVKLAKEEDALKRMIILFKESFNALKIFTYKNKKHQKILFQYLNVFTSNLRIQVGQIDLLCDIFRDNSELCQLISEDLLQQFVNLILNEGRQADFLNLFEVVTEVNGVGIPHMQRLVFMLLTNSKYSNRTLYMNSDKKFEFTEYIPDKLTTYKDQPFAYHAKLISVLTKCGPSTATLKYIKAKCQKIIPLSHIFELLSKSGEFSYLEIYLLNFLLKIYLSGPEKNEDFENNFNELNKVVKIKVKQLVDEINENRINLAKIENWMKFLTDFDRIYNELDENSCGHEAIDDYLILLTSNMQHLSSFKFSKEFKDNFESLCIKYNLSFPEGIDLRIEETQDQPQDPSDKLITILEPFRQKSFKAQIKQETREILQLIHDISLIDKEIKQQDLIESLIEFISKSMIFKLPETVLYSALKFLLFYIPKAKQDDKTQLLRRKEIQDHLRSCRIVQVILDLICEKSSNKKIFTTLLNLCIKLLDGGNFNIQNDFYSYFNLLSKSENFFYLLHNTIKEHIALFTINKESNWSNIFALKKSNKVVKKIVKLLQLFCENHFELLQNYIRVQEKSHNNYDLVMSVVNLLSELMRSERESDFLVISQCFETLTECIQGPCYANQKAIINSKFLEIAGELLSIDEQSDSLEIYEKFKMQKKYFLTNSQLENPGNFFESEKSPDGALISELKYKCMITIMALLEGQSDNYNLIRMVRTFNLSIFRENLVSIYRNHKILKDIQYSKDPLEDKPHQPDNPRKDVEKKSSFIVKVGFQIYFLLNHFIDLGDTEIKKMLKNEIPEFVDLSEAQKKYYSNPSNRNKQKLLNFNTKKYFEDTFDICQALRFFNDNSANVEVVFQGILCKTYFWLPPVCHHLTFETKDEFNRNVDRSSSKKKAEYLVKRAKGLVKDMSYEQSLSLVYGYKIIADNVRKLKLVAFLLSIIMNIIILLSYNNFGSDRLNDPQFGKFELDSTKDVWTTEKTKAVILGLGVIQAILSGLIFLFFIIKTAPILILRSWYNQDSNSESSTKKVLQTIINISLNFDVLYHFLYFIFSILAISLHPFFYSAHLLEIMYRFPILQGVVKSISVPWRALLLTLIFILVIVYLFSVWAYFRLRSTFTYLCDSLFLCFVNNFDKGIKNWGGSGVWVDYMNDASGLLLPEEIDSERFIFDTIFILIIWYVLMNIVQGIIYVTFAVVRKQDEDNLNDLENICFICGENKETVERLTEKPFNYHRLLEHNQWNYIFFLAYLQLKETTEYSGIESHVYELNNQMKIDWIPQQQCISFMAKEKQEVNLLIENASTAKEQLGKYQRTLKTLKKKMKKNNN